MTDTSTTPNFFDLLGLDPTIKGWDRAEFERKLAEKQSEWRKLAMMPPPAGPTANRNLALISEIKRVMGDPGDPQEREKQRNRALFERAAAREERLRAFEEALAISQLRGVVYKEEIDNWIAKYKDIPEAEIRRRITVKIKRRDRPRLDELTAKQIREKLNFLHEESLYSLLRLPENSRLEVLKTASNKLYLASIKVANKNAIDTTKGELGGLGSNSVFTTEDMRERYDNTLRQQQIEAALTPYEDSWVVAKETHPQQMLMFLSTAREKGWDEDEVMDVLKERGQKRGFNVIPPGTPSGREASAPPPQASAPPREAFAPPQASAPPKGDPPKEKEPIPAPKNQYDMIRLDKLIAKASSVGTAEVCLLGGVGALVGILTQEWWWAVGTIAILAVLAYVLGYRKVLPLVPFSIIAAASAVVVVVLTLFLATFPYDTVQTIHFSFLFINFTRILTLRHQIIAGASIGAVTSLLSLNVLSSSREKNNAFEDNLYTIAIGAGIVVGSIVWLVVIALGSIFDWGFGFGFGWLVSLLSGFLVTQLAGTGLSCLLCVGVKARGAWGLRDAARLRLEHRFGDPLDEDLEKALSQVDEATIQAMMPRLATDSLEKVRAKLGLSSRGGY